MSRMSALLSIVLLLPTFTHAKDKNKVILPTYVLQAQTVLVVINPEAGEPLTDPTANRRTQDEVERALMKWGRFRIVTESQTADLVMAVRRGSGHVATPTISNSPIDNNPVILQPSDGGVRIGGHGQPPDLTQPGLGPPRNTGPRMQTEVGGSEDTLDVYRGGQEYPLDSAPVWRYRAKDALRSPAVPAVDQFRKVVDEAEKAAAQKQKKTP